MDPCRGRRRVSRLESQVGLHRAKGAGEPFAVVGSIREPRQLIAGPVSHAWIPVPVTPRIHVEYGGRRSVASTWRSMFSSSTS